jgi:hypothetical protein
VLNFPQELLLHFVLFQHISQPVAAKERTLTGNTPSIPKLRPAPSWCQGVVDGFLLFIPKLRRFHTRARRRDTPAGGCVRGAAGRVTQSLQVCRAIPAAEDADRPDCHCIPTAGSPDPAGSPVDPAGGRRGPDGCVARSRRLETPAWRWCPRIRAAGGVLPTAAPSLPAVGAVLPPAGVARPTAAAARPAAGVAGSTVRSKRLPVCTCFFPVPLGGRRWRVGHSCGFTPR